MRKVFYILLFSLPFIMCGCSATISIPHENDDAEILGKYFIINDSKRGLRRLVNGRKNHRFGMLFIMCLSFFCLEHI